MRTYFQTTVFFRRFAVHLVVCLALVATALFLYRSERRATREEALNELRAVSALKTAQLMQWLKERKSEAAFFSGSEPFRTEFIALVDQKPANDTLLRDALQKIMSDNRYEQIFLLGAQGNLIFSANPDFVAIDTATAQYSSAVFRSRQITVSDICFCSIHNEPHYEILAPVFDLENRVAATLVFRINPNDYLYPLIETWPGLSKT